MVQPEGYSCWGQPKISEGVPVPVKVVKISWELLHEMDWQYPKNYEEQDTGGIVEVVNAVDMLFFEDGRSLQFIMLLLLCLDMQVMKGLKLI